ncbi:S-layer homology domain-containing protein [Sporosarcina highlanderae]|uniref:S-layer homology domain-containing protein n=1 Tax=Sporosarcina highlanderae TaxID=3035916 RepID=A0ABT8JNB8_9BACL|nr:S-layer homology domain-containing protein [Sporosarcina highlanderae]MDN4605882.1 S-layer homology domain-containing protein [Sporosarcina highlanderae]
MKIVTMIVMTIILFIGFGIKTEASELGDVNKNHWSYDHIKTLTDKGVISGYGDGTYKPDRFVTRAEAAKIIHGALELKNKTMFTPSFADLPQAHWAYDYVTVLTEQKTFTDANKFNPNNHLTRAEMAKIIVLGFGFTKEKELAFNDVRPSDWHSVYVKRLTATGVTSGVSATKYDPSGKVTRAQLAAFIDRAMKAKVSPNGVYVEPPKISENDNINLDNPYVARLLTEKEIEKLVQDNFKYLNEEREKHGLKPLKLNLELSKISQMKAKEMYDKNYFSHRSPTYGSPSEMMRSFGHKGGYAENIAMNYRSGQEAVQGWMMSPGHRENILDEYVDTISIGVYGRTHIFNYRIYWVNNFTDSRSWE